MVEQYRPVGVFGQQLAAGGVVDSPLAGETSDGEHAAVPRPGTALRALLSYNTTHLLH